MIDFHKEIIINSPPGSGNMFCQSLMKENLHFELKWVNHDPEKFDEHLINLFILRNPYDAVASSIELLYHDLAIKNKKYFLDNYKFRIGNTIIEQLNIYNTFLNYAKKFNYIHTADFDIITTQPELFLDTISKKFDIPFKKNMVNHEDVKLEMLKDKFLATRLPREKSDLRKIIDKEVRRYYLVKDTHEMYLEYKKELSIK